MNTHERLAHGVKKDGVYRAGPGTLSAADAEALFHHNPTTFALRVGSGGTGCRTGGGQTGKTAPGFKSCREAPGRGDADAGRIPRQQLVHLAGTGQGTRVATYASLHPRCPSGLSW